MLFGNKQRIEELEAQNQQLSQQLQAAQEQVDAIDQEKSDLLTQLNEKEAFYQNARSVMLQLIDSVQSIDIVRNSVASLAEDILEKDKAMSDLNEVFSESTQVLQNISGTVSNIGERASESSQKMGSLRDVSDSIANFVSVITNISDQTNLLALNAAIEAARAGDQGRGFAVVADEVRSLAQNTGNATSEIGSLIDTIDNDSETAAKQIDQLCEYTATIAEQNQSLGSTYSHILDSSKEMREVIHRSALSAFIQTVKLDHVMWKAEVYAVIFEHSNKSIDDFARHTDCRLGKWYYNGDGKHFAHLSAFNAVEEPHKRVHAAGIEAMLAARENNAQETNQALKQMEAASMDVFRHLAELKNV